MKPTYCAALLIAALAFVIPQTARAEIKAGSFEVTPFGGYNFFNGQNLKDAPLIGGRLGYNFTRYFGAEIVGEYIQSRVDDRSKVRDKEGHYGSPMDDVNLTFYHVDAVVHLVPDGRFNPFIVAGYGMVHSSPEISDKDMSAFNIGVGAKLWLTDHIALRLDVKDYMVTEILQETFHNVGGTVGLTFAFGGDVKPAPAPVAKQEPKPEPKPVAKPVAKAEPKVVEKIVIVVAEPKAAEKIKIVKAEPKIVVLAFEDIHFDFDQSTLKPEAQQILIRDVKILRDNPKAQIRIAGYTSASGTTEYNQKLSERRAKAVQEYLINEGIITPDRLSTVGYGETNPANYEAAPTEIYSEEAKSNMRVLFEIIVQ